jgi:hypothetical protein
MPFCFEFGDEHGPETPHMNTPMLICLPPNMRKTEALHIHKATIIVSLRFSQTLAKNKAFSHI